MPRQSVYSPSDTMEVCPVCQGSGFVPDPDQPEVTIRCPYCDGAGRIDARTANPAALASYRERVTRAAAARRAAARKATARKASVRKAGEKKSRKDAAKPKKPAAPRRLREARKNRRPPS